MSVSLEKINPVVSAVRIMTVGGSFAWIDVRRHTSTVVTVGYRDRKSGVTRYMQSSCLDFLRVVNREIWAESRADNLRDVYLLCGSLV
jgi:hypothetical protein